MAASPKEQNPKKRATHELVVLQKHPAEVSLQGSHPEPSTEQNYAQTIRDMIRKYEHAALKERERNKRMRKQLLNTRKKHKVPKPNTKPRLVKEEPAPLMEVHVSGESEYAQLKPRAPAETESETHYETLCQATRERNEKQDGDTASFYESGKQQELELCDLGNYENHEFKAAMEELHERDFNRHCCLVYWKAILGIATIALAAIVIVLVLLLIATLGLVHANGNTESYQKLQRMTAKMAKEIATLERQLNNSVATSSDTLTDHILILENQLNSSLHNLQTQLNHSVQVSKQRDDLFDKSLHTIQQNLTSLRYHQETNYTTLQGLSSDVVSLDNRIQQVDTSLMGTATDVNRLSSELTATKNMLNNKVGKLSRDSMALNRSLLGLTTLAVPIDCNSRVFTTIAVNATSASSQRYSLQSVSNFIIIEY